MCVCVCVCVRSGGTSSDSTTIKEAVFCNFDLMYLPCYLYPPHMPYDGVGYLEGRVQYSPVSVSCCCLMSVALQNLILIYLNQMSPVNLAGAPTCIVGYIMHEEDTKQTLYRFTQLWDVTKIFA